MRLQIFAIAAVLLLAGCTAPQAQNASAGGQQAPQQLTPSEACMMECQKKFETGADLSKGPCLSNEIAPDWVCDVAHNPREAVDDDPANQCPAYGHTAHHFVEVDPNCNFITEV